MSKNHVLALLAVVAGMATFFGGLLLLFVGDGRLNSWMGAIATLAGICGVGAGLIMLATSDSSDAGQPKRR